MAATHLAQFDAGMQYASEVGINAFVKMGLSFLAKEVSILTSLSAIKGC